MVIEDAIKTCFKKYFSTQGRASRSEFWYFAVVTGVVHLFQNIFVSRYLFAERHFALYHLYIALIAVVLAIPFCTAAVRRIKDIDRSPKIGWIGAISALCIVYDQSLYLALEIVLTHSPFSSSTQQHVLDLKTPIAAFCTIFSIYFFVLSIHRGTDGTNKYGPDPLAVEEYGEQAEDAEKVEETEKAGDLAPAAAAANTTANTNTDTVAKAPAPQATGAANAQPTPFAQQPLAPNMAPPADTDNIPQVKLKAAELEQIGYVELTPEQIQQLPALSKTQDQNSTNKP